MTQARGESEERRCDGAPGGNERSAGAAAITLASDPGTQQGPYALIGNAREHILRDDDDIAIRSPFTVGVQQGEHGIGVIGQCIAGAHDRGLARAQWAFRIGGVANRPRPLTADGVAVHGGRVMRGIVLQGGQWRAEQGTPGLVQARLCRRKRVRTGASHPIGLCPRQDTVETEAAHGGDAGTIPVGSCAPSHGTSLASREAKDRSGVGDDPAHARVAAAPPGAADRTERDVVTRIARIDHATAADVDADVAGTVLEEEDEITGLGL